MKRHVGIIALLCLAIAGCVNPQTRLQMAEDSQRDMDLDVKTIRDVTEVDNLGPIQVSGVALVTNLNGTGGSPLGEYRTLLEQQLRKQKVERVKELLDSPDNALVLVTAFITAGTRKGERFDVEVTLPKGSKATSLAGGYLQDCALRDHNTTKSVSPEYEGANRLLIGHILGKAKGPLLVGFGGDREANETRRARVWQGCASLIDRPFYLTLRKDDKSARIANSVVDRLNFMFQEGPQRIKRLPSEQKQLLFVGDVTETLNGKAEGGVIARAKSKEVVEVRIPYGYRFNAERYLLVACNVPLREDPELMNRYRGRLKKMITNPAETIRAAVRLEALGKESIPILKEGLTHEHPLVRFACAESLAYLGSTAGVEELALLARQQPIMTSYCLLALANLDESICRTKLHELLAEEDIELRCGAFFALRLIDERDSRLGGELLGHTFWLHQVAPNSAKLVHFNVAKRAEVVVFGGDVAVVRPVRALSGDFTVTREQDDDRCTVSRISAETGRRFKQCPVQLDAVLRTLTELGADYPDVVELLRKFEEQQCLNCPVRVNALPPSVPIDVLVESGRSGANLRDAAPVSETVVPD